MTVPSNKKPHSSMLKAILALKGARPGSKHYFDQARDLSPIVVLLADQADENGVIMEDAPYVNWMPGRCDNGSMLVIGSSGSGKTESLRRIGSEIISHGIPLLVLDFHGDIDIKWVDTVLLSAGRSSLMGINPLEVFIHDENRVGLVDQRMAMVGMLKRAIPTLSQNQMAILERAIKGAYEYNGILDDAPETWRGRAPMMSHVVDELEEMLKGKGPYKGQYTPQSIRGCMNAVKAIFDHTIFNRRDNINIRDLFSRNIRLDLSSVDDSVRFIVAETVLRMLFNYLRRMGPVPSGTDNDADRFRIYVMIDEAKILAMGKGDPDGRDRILNILTTEGRKYGLGLILASQSIRHFGSDVKANIASRLLLRHLDGNEARLAVKGMRLAWDALLELQGKGDGYFLNGETGRFLRVRVCRS